MSERSRFVAARRPRWQRLEHLLGPTKRLKAGDWAELASLYRSVCADLARARALDLSEDVSTYLDQLAGRAHNRLYAVRKGTAAGLLHTIAFGVPVEVRRNWRFFLMATLLFYGPFFVTGLAAWLDPEFASLLVPEGMLRQMEAAYSEPAHRTAGEDAMMAGFYVYNNVGIAFRCFATGILFGLGSVFFLVYNGLVLGAVLGFLHGVGNGANLMAFTSGHSAWELTGIVVSGTAGLRMGWALVETGGRTRLGSLQAAGPTLFRLVLGAAVMLLIAAAIEGFWSALPLPHAVKYAFGLLQVVIVALWLVRGGRRS